MMNEAIVTSDIIVKGFVVTKNNTELIEKYKKIFPNYYMEQYPESFFFIDLDRIISVRPFAVHIGEYVQLILKPFMGESNYRLTRVITMEALNEIKKLLIQRNRYDILFNLEG